MCAASPRSLALSAVFLLLVTCLIFPATGYSQKFRLLLKYEVADGQYIYLPVLAEVSSQVYKQDFILSGIIGTEGQKKEIILNTVAPAMESPNASAKLHTLSKDEKEGVEAESQTELFFSKSDKDFEFRWTKKDSPIKVYLNPEPEDIKNWELELFKTAANDKAVLLDPGVLWTALEAKNAQSINFGKQDDQELSPLAKIALLKGLRSLSVGDSLSVDDALQYSGENSNLGVIPQKNDVIWPVSALPLRRIVFPQKIKPIQLWRSKGNKVAGTIHLLTYKSMPERGALISGFTLMEEGPRHEYDTIQLPHSGAGVGVILKEKGIIRGKHYVIQIAFPDDAQDEIWIGLIPDTKRTTEESAYSAKSGEYASITIKNDGNCIVRGKELEADSVHKFKIETELTLPVAKAIDLEEELKSKVNFSELLRLASLLKKQIGQTEKNFQEADVTEVIGNLFSPKKAGNQENDPIITLDEWAETNTKIRFSDSAISIKKIYVSNDDRGGAVLGPVYLHTPEGYGQYVFQVMQTKDGAFEVLRFRSNSPQHVLAGLVRNKMTGQPYSFDFAKMVIEPEPVSGMEKIIKVRVTPSYKEEEHVVYAGRWPETTAQFLNLAEIIQVLSKVSNSPEVSSFSQGVNPDHLFCLAENEYWLPKRDYEVIPHWRGALTRYPVFLAKAPGKLVRSLWRHKGKAVVGATAAGSIYMLANHPELAGDILDSLPDSADVFEASLPMVRAMFQRLGLDAYCPPAEPVFDEEQCMDHVIHATANILSDQGKNEH